jgi:hypothetical protein
MARKRDDGQRLATADRWQVSSRKIHRMIANGDVEVIPSPT